MKPGRQRVSLLDVIRQQQAADQERDSRPPEDASEYLRGLAREKSAPGELNSQIAEAEAQQWRYALGWHVMNENFPKVTWSTGEVLDGEADWERYIRDASNAEIKMMCDFMHVDLTEGDEPE